MKVHPVESISAVSCLSWVIIIIIAMADIRPEVEIDLSKLEPVPFKQMVAVLNEYMLNTLDFMNKFCHFNENKLYEMEQILDEVDSKVLLLEAKLDSLPPQLFENMSAAPLG